MSTQSIRLYDILRKNFKLPEGEAREMVGVIQDLAKEQGTDNMTIVNKDIQSLKEYLDVKFATKDEVAHTKVDLVRWMFIFWIGQIAATFGFILLFLKK